MSVVPIEAERVATLSPAFRAAVAWARPRSEAVVRASRWVGALLERTPLPLASLAEDDLLEAARRETGVSEWADDSFRPALRVLLHALDEEARLNFVGRVGLRRELIRLLSLRLCIEEDARRHPEILEAPIRRPVFVVGLPRTGTTLLHRLLSEDPGGRAPLLWELWYPSIPPRADLRAGDPRIARTERTLELMSVMAPSFSSIHHLVATEPDECFHVLHATFLCAMFAVRAEIRSYSSWRRTRISAPPTRSTGVSCSACSGDASRAGGC